MSAIESHSLGVSNTLLDGDREGMNNQPHSHLQCLYKSAHQLCLYVLILGEGILIEEENEKPDTTPPLTGIPGLCMGQNQRLILVKLF